MKTTFRLFFVTLLAASSVVAHAAEYDDVAHVVSVSERTSGGNRPVRECDNGGSGERGLMGAGLGAVAGGVIGNQIGKGNGKTVATAVGAVAGALTGDRIQNGSGAGSGGCRTVDSYNTRVVGYNVTYEYNGNTFTDYVSTVGYSNGGHAPNPGDAIRVRVRLTPQR